MCLVNINESEWSDIGNSTILCQIPFSKEIAEERLGIKFLKIVEEGLGEENIAFIKVKSYKYLIKILVSDDGTEHWITVFILSTSKAPSQMLDSILECFNVDRDDLLWVRENLAPPSWRLIRLDDNGNEVEMFNFLDEGNALALKRHYEIKGHKQSYFIRKTE